MADNTPIYAADAEPHLAVPSLESRFLVAAVIQDVPEDEEKEESDSKLQFGEVDDFDDEEVMMRARAFTSVSQCTQSDLSRLGMLTAIDDAGSVLGSSVLLSTPSYLNILNEVSKSHSQKLEAIADGHSMEYLDTLLDNADYIDTVQGKLLLADAARMIAKDRTKHEQLFSRFYIKKVKIECYKKLICIGLSFLCLFGTFFSLRNIQSSISTDDPTLGLITYGCLRSFMWLAGILATPIMSKIRPKWTLVLASISFLLYPISNFYPAAYTLIPCALLLSFGIGLIWNAESIYLVNLAAKYAFVSKKPMMDVIGKFNGIVFAIYQCSHLVGNLLTSLLLSDKIQWFPVSPLKAVNEEQVNSTMTTYRSIWKSTTSNSFTDSYNSTPPIEMPDTCGLRFFSTSQVSQSLGSLVIDQRQYYICFGMMTFLAFVGFLILAVILKPLKTLRTAGNDNLLMNTRKFWKMLIEPRILLIVPYMLYPGVSGSIATADYPKAYITCAYGISYVGYVMVAGAIFSITCAFVSGRIVYKTGRVPLFLFGSVLSCASMVIMLYWKPTRGENGDPLVFLPLCLWCSADGIILTQLHGFLGEMFRTEIVFALSTLHLYFGGGTVLGTLSSAFQWISLETKIYVVIAHTWIAFALLVVLERLRKQKKFQ